MAVESWFVPPETKWLDLPGNERIEVKKRLNLGEERKAQAAIITELRADGRITPNFEMMGKAEVLAYLVDWTLRGPDGKPTRIDTDARKVAAVDSLDPQKFRVISDAITAHIECMTAEREAEKRTGWREQVISDLAICRVMRWTLPQLEALPREVYEVLVDELIREQDEMKA